MLYKFRNEFKSYEMQIFCNIPHMVIIENIF